MNHTTQDELYSQIDERIPSSSSGDPFLNAPSHPSVPQNSLTSYIPGVSTLGHLTHGLNSILDEYDDNEVEQIEHFKYKQVLEKIECEINHWFKFLYYGCPIWNVFNFMDHIG